MQSMPMVRIQNTYAQCARTIECLAHDEYGV